MKKLIFVFFGVLLLLACEEIINEENIENETVIALAPLQSSTLKTGTQLNYNWQGISGASDYEIQIATPSFDRASQVLIDSLVSTPFLRLDSLAMGAYEWRVRALNSAFSTGYTTNSFSVEP